jgi:Multicopper oxidase
VSRRESRFQGPRIPPDPDEAGWKDTVRADAGMLTGIIVRFEGYPGRYVWHCHILEHEDSEMMRPYDILPAHEKEALGWWRTPSYSPDAWTLSKDSSVAKAGGNAGSTCISSLFASDSLTSSSLFVDGIALHRNSSLIARFTE